jgi:hypothetical protein
VESFQALLDADWGDRYLDPATGSCPICGGDQLVIVETVDYELNLLCHGCGRCWSVEGNRMHRVDPVRCPGCSQQARCFDRLRDDIPNWGTSGWDGRVG